MTTQVSINRSGLSLAPLVIGSGGNSTYWLATDGLGAPGFTHRRTLATAAYVHGDLQTAAVLEQSSLPLIVYIGGNTAAALRNNVEALIAALRQFYFTTTITIDDYAETWGCDCADIGAATYLRSEMSALIQRREITIPVYPIAGAF